MSKSSNSSKRRALTESMRAQNCQQLSSTHSTCIMPEMPATIRPHPAHTSTSRASRAPQPRREETRQFCIMQGGSAVRKDAEQEKEVGQTEPVRVQCDVELARLFLVLPGQTRASTPIPGSTSTPCSAARASAGQWLHKGRDRTKVAQSTSIMVVSFQVPGIVPSSLDCMERLCISCFGALSTQRRSA